MGFAPIIDSCSSFIKKFFSINGVC